MGLSPRWVEYMSLELKGGSRCGPSLCHSQRPYGGGDLSFSFPQVPRWGDTSIRRHRILLNLKVRLLPDHSEQLVPVD